MNSAADLTCTNVYGNVSGNWGYDCISDQYGINGNIGEDPLFCGGQSQVSPFTLCSVRARIQPGLRPHRCLGC